MPEATPPIFGLRLGLVCLSLSGAAIAGFLQWSGAGAIPDQTPPEPVELHRLAEIFPDRPTQSALTALARADPVTYARLERLIQKAGPANTQPAELSPFILDAMFAQFRAQDYAMQYAETGHYAQILTRFAEGLKALAASDSAWCHGPQLVEFLSQNSHDLVPALLDHFDYASPQYIWAMAFMSDLMDAAHAARKAPIRHAPPRQADEVLLQKAGRALGAEQWQLALQIVAFANTEGQGYGPMQAVIAQLDVCALGQAVASVSGRLPATVSARIWADLMPEIMVGNTPYALARITDYFFIG